jgi:DNA-binding NtrC family response regulator
MTWRGTEVIVVDDDAYTVDVVSEILSASGFTVHGARNATDAMVALGDNPVSTLLLTDIRMPGINGIVLADMAKVHNPEIRVLYMSSFDMPEFSVGVRQGYTIKKPFHPNQLVAAVRISCVDNGPFHTEGPASAAAFCSDHPRDCADGEPGAGGAQG